jgi:hypothetical protein
MAETRVIAVAVVVLIAFDARCGAVARANCIGGAPPSKAAGRAEDSTGPRCAPALAYRKRRSIQARNPDIQAAVVPRSAAANRWDGETEGKVQKLVVRIAAVRVDLAAPTRPGTAGSMAARVALGQGCALTTIIGFRIARRVGGKTTLAIFANVSIVGTETARVPHAGAISRSKRDYKRLIS